MDRENKLPVVLEYVSHMQNPAEGIPESQAWFWTKEVQTLLRKAEDDYNNGDYLTFKNADELITFLNARDNVS
ncbi:hypothetical protein MBAV_002543 [Candidatus Magnetobacterium bavaricum]|uniref:Uncharacterized protein n=1 Tax=Candidatus Magnetobacterium bavaricum TaxID=29290 RepID=A0A0F3GTV7_9BACT|nr:hypothetical protein MBAV_002543 [Candidatus Magnetobacterium bavaricum]